MRGCRYLTVLWIVFCTVVQSLASDDDASYVEAPVTDDDRLHWSFQSIEHVDVPSVADPKWCRNEIDHFILAALKEQNLRPQREADRTTLIRRVSFDLVGLPPSPEQVDAFVTDRRPGAYERLVESLLASPSYGQRWAQHWLDLARFAETDGFEHDKIRPEAWKYRDWVIDALNRDMPYDEFIRQQIAGDELYPGNDSAVTATRFCLSGPDMPDINLIDERRHTVLNELTSTVGEVVVGLQIGCAQCHDHKYDPISQADFYRMRAVFEPAVQLKKNVSLSVLDESPSLEQTSHVMIRGDFRRPGPVIQPGVVRVAAPDGWSLQSAPTQSHSGRRTALAQWMTSKQNPLTARVIANRVWQHHFGTGLVDTPSEFGVMGSLPSNEGLLDWLSLTLMDQGWSLKSLHRMIVCSATYRQRSFLSPDASDSDQKTWNRSLNVDPDARLLSRFPRLRLEGETIRDAILACVGRLNHKSGGEGIRPPLPPELVGTLLRNQWKVTRNAADHDRRSIYLFARRNLRYPIFEAFDRPSANSSCACRNVSTTAPQSLHLLNSEFTLRMAEALAEKICREHSELDRKIAAAFRRVLSRYPSRDEKAAVIRYWKSSEPLSQQQRVRHLCLSLFNSNEFVMVD